VFNWFNAALALIVGSIVLTIVKAVRQTKTVIDKNLKDVDPAKRDEIAKKLLQTMSTRDIDLSRFDDPVAAQTDWSPANGGGSSFTTHTIAKVSPYRIEFQASGGAKVFSMIFSLMGIGTIFGFSFFHFSNGTFSISLGAVAPLLFGIIFFFIGAGLFYYFTTPIVFDKKKAFFWKGRKDPYDDFVINTVKDFARLDEIHAIQVVPENYRGNNVSYRSYELNLVLKDGRRINVVDHGNESRLREDALTLSRFIEKPVWDAVKADSN
jgi:hypothetical protein